MPAIDISGERAAIPHAAITKHITPGRQFLPVSSSPAGLAEEDDDDDDDTDPERTPVNNNNMPPTASKTSAQQTLPSLIPGFLDRSTASTASPSASTTRTLRTATHKRTTSTTHSPTTASSSKPSSHLPPSSIPMIDDDDEFEGIQEISESEFPPELVPRSVRKRPRTSIGTKNGEFCGELTGRAMLTRPATPPSSNWDTDAIDLSGPSSSPPLLRSSRTSPDKMDTSPIPPRKPPTRRRVVSDTDMDESDDDRVPLTKPASKDKGKGKARPIVEFTPEPEVEPEALPGLGASKSRTAHRGSGGSDADESDEFDFDDLDATALYGLPFPGDGYNMPNFAARSRSAQMVEDDDDRDPLAAIGITNRPKTKTPKGKTSATGGVQALANTTSLPVVEFADLTLLPQLDERWQAFYRDHWRRGADNSDDERDGGGGGGGGGRRDDGDEEQEFGVAVQASKPGRGGFGRFGGRPSRGGRGKARGWKRGRGKR